MSRCGTEAETSAFVRIREITDMSSNAGIFFAGVGTTCVVLAVGFAGGFIVARPAPKESTLREPAGYQARANTESMTPVRVIMPASAEAAQNPQPSAVAVAAPEQEPQPQVQPAVKEVQSPIEKPVEKADRSTAESEERQRRKRYAQYKAKRTAAARARQQEAQTGERSEPVPMAFGGDWPRSGGGLFGN